MQSLNKALKNPIIRQHTLSPNTPSIPKLATESQPKPLIRETQKLNALLSRNKISQAESLVKKLKEKHNHRLDLFTYNSILRIHQKKREPEKAVEVLSEIQERGFTPNEFTYSTIIDSFGRKGNTTEMVHWFNKMKEVGLKPNAVVYNSILHSFRTKGQASEVVKWFEEMKQNGIEPDTAIYTELVTLYTKQGNIKEMMKWYSMLVQSNQQPNAPLLVSMINLCRAQKDTQNEQICLEALAKINPEHTLVKNPKTYETNKKLSLLLKQNKFSELEHIYLSMDIMGVKRDMWTFSLMTKYYCKTLNYSALSKLVEHMIDAGVEPNELIYNQIIDSHAKSGKLEEMMHWFDDMLDKGVKPSKITLTSMLAAHKKLNNRTGELQVLDYAKKNQIELFEKYSPLLLPEAEKKPSKKHMNRLKKSKPLELAQGKDEKSKEELND